jgi:3-hydroxyisobutyrate dehydrogenase
MPRTTVAVLGLGTMGDPIARNLVRTGFVVRVWNRTREKAEPLARMGAFVADTAAEAADGAHFVVTMLTDLDAVLETMEGERGALGSMDPDAIWLQLSTVGVDGAAWLAQLAGEHGVAYIDAPVLGTREPAEKGELVILAAGPDELRTWCAPVFDAIGKETHWLGAAGNGSRMKMVVNMWLLALTEAAAESVALAEALDVDPREFLDIMRGSPTDAPYLHIKGEAILDRNLEPSFKLRLAAKDARLVLEAAGRTGIEPRVLRATRDSFLRAIALGHGDDDMAATYFATAKDDYRSTRATSGWPSPAPMTTSTDRSGSGSTGSSPSR